MIDKKTPTLTDIKTNAEKINPFIRKTPVLKTTLAASDASLKLEIMQKTGTFKIRGALTHLHALSKEEKKTRRYCSNRR